MHVLSMNLRYHQRDKSGAAQAHAEPLNGAVNTPVQVDAAYMIL